MTEGVLARSDDQNLAAAPNAIVKGHPAGIDTRPPLVRRIMRRTKGGNRRGVHVAVTIFVGALVVSGCSASPSGAPAPTTSSSERATSAGTGPVAAGPEWGHVHNLTLDGDQLLLGTHDGLWQQSPGTPAQLLSDPPFDVMAFALSGGRMLGSGHPGEGKDLPADLGLRESTDGGTTWTSVSLEGEVDFHRLRVAGATVVGLSAHDGRLLRSDDDGRTWTDLGIPPLYDFALDPTDSNHVVGTTERGPVVSTDGGASFDPIAAAPLLALLAWAPKALYGVAPDGVVHASTDGGLTWQVTGSVVGQPAALAAGAGRVIVLAGETIMESTDGGATFTPRITGISGH